MADVAYVPIEEGQQQQTGYGPVRHAQKEIRLGFVRKVYGILCVQLLMTIVIALPFQQMSPQDLQGKAWMLPISMFLSLASICCMACVPSLARNFPMNYLMLALFTGAEGVLVGFVSAQYNANVVLAAAGVTMIIFACLSVYAWTTKTDFTGYGPYLFAALCGLTIFGFGVALATNVYGMQFKTMSLVYSLCSILLFMFYIIYDTQMMLGDYGGHSQQFEVDDYVFAAITLYLDIINIFLQLLKLFGDDR